MSTRVALTADQLSPYADGPDAPLWWGFAGMILIEVTVFATLIASYFYLRGSSPMWPPSGVAEPKLLLPTINTVVLVASSVVLHRADKSITRGEDRKLATGLALAAGLATVFLVLKVIEYLDVPYRWDDHAYGSIVWTIIGFHSAHVLGLLLKTVVVDTLAWRRYFNQRRRLGVTVNGLYWHFVVAVWIPLYLVLYWVPRAG